MVNCWFCGGQLNWNCDYDFEDYGLEGEGIVATLTCSECGASWEGYLGTNSDEEIEDDK